MNTPTSTTEGDLAEMGLERLVFFSDAVIAIAITLLAIEIRLPDTTSAAALGRSLIELWPRYMSFAISFVVIGMYWMAHHSMFMSIRRFDRTLIWLNLLFLACIAFIPFPTAVVGEYGDTPLAQAFYASSIAVTGFAKAGMWAYASHHEDLLVPGLSWGERRALTLRGLTVPFIFLLSIPFTFVNFVIPIIMWPLTPFVVRVLTSGRRAQSAA